MNDLEAQKAPFELNIALRESSEILASTSGIGLERLPDSRSQTSRKGVNIFSAYQKSKDQK